MGADGALREDVIAALSRAPGVTVTRHTPEIIEVSKQGEPIRTFPLKATVKRGLLYELERYYGVPIAAFYPLPFVASKKDAI